MQIIYSTKATATGGRNGHVQSEDGALNIEVKTPAPGATALNPETLFAGGYAACFGSALEGILKKEKVEASGFPSITAEVSLGKNDSGAYALSVKLVGEIPGLDQQQTSDLMRKAHEVCPYSNATRNNIEVVLEAR